MNPSTHLSDPYHPWWDPDAGLEAPMNADASWYPNQAPGPYYEIPHEQHGFGSHPQEHTEDFHPRSHRARKRLERNPDLGIGEFKVNSHRPVWSVPPENVSRTSKDDPYEFAESCHEFMARPNTGVEKIPQDVDAWRRNTRKKGMPRQDRHYTQEVEWDNDYVYEAQRTEFDYDRRAAESALDADQEGRPPALFCPHPNCGYGCMDKNSLRKHMSIHGARKYSCEKCSADFHTSRDLRRHQGTKHGISKARKYYVCKVPGCDRGEHWPFSRKDNARQHVINVHEIGSRVDDMIEEIIETPSKQASGAADTGFRAGHRTRGSSSTDDTAYSNVSYDSNPGYHSYEDPEAEDIIAEFTYLQECDSDLDINYRSPNSGAWQTQGMRDPESIGQQLKGKSPNTTARFFNRRKSDAQWTSRSALESESHVFPNHQQNHITQNENISHPEYSERSHSYVDRSAIDQFEWEHIKEESPASSDLASGQPHRSRRLRRTASAERKQSNKHSSGYKAKVYRSETSDAPESLEDVFEKVLVI